MRCLLSIAVCAVLLAPLRAQDGAPAVNPAKASLALAKAARSRAEIQPSAASNLLKQCKLERSERSECMEDLNAAQLKAAAEKRYLFLWVGMTCDKEIRKAFPQAVHCHVGILNGSNAPRLTVVKGRETWTMQKHQLGPQMIAPIQQWLAPVLAPPKTSFRAPAFVTSDNC